PDVRLVGDEEIDVLAGEPGALERLVRGLGHRPDRRLEHLAPRHLDQVRALLENLGIERDFGTAARPPQKLRERAVGPHEARDDTPAVLTALDNRRACAVTEQDARRS